MVFVPDPSFVNRSRVWALGPLTLYVGRQSDPRSHFMRDAGMVDIKIRRCYAGLCW
jgi:hypothetical protein